jgi:GTP cyclohydrolase I
MTTIDAARRLELVPAPTHEGRRIDRGAAERAVSDLLAALGADSSDEGLRETPRRMVEAYAELLTPRPFRRTTTFPNTDGYEELRGFRLSARAS